MAGNGGENALEENYRSDSRTKEKKRSALTTWERAPNPLGSSVTCSSSFIIVVGERSGTPSSQTKAETP